MSSSLHRPPAIWSPPPEAPSGKYRIVRPLKLGGTAAIYLAVMRGENNFSREVVIKRPLPHLVAESRSRAMFIDEAHIASRLSHPNIGQVLDLVAREDELYIVLEYLRGVDLREVLKRCVRLGCALPPEVAVWIAIEIAAGLDYAHFATTVDGRPLHLVHRDVSPKNIRLTYEGSVKVIDFGIARAEHRLTQTSSGTIKGTLGYMSPEQILGDDIDRRSDVFAFGIVLFQMLTLHNPFDGATLKERLRKLTHDPIPSVRSFAPSLDGDLAAIVARCLERGVDARYGRLREVQAALDEHLAQRRIGSPKPKLIALLQELFAGGDDADPALKSALLELSQLSGPIDPSVRLRFPDDPPTEPAASPGEPSTSEASGPTTPAAAASDPVEGVTEKQAPARSGSIAATVRPGSQTARTPDRARPRFDSGFDQAATRPPPPRGPPKVAEPDNSDPGPSGDPTFGAAGAEETVPAPLASRPPHRRAISRPVLAMIGVAVLASALGAFGVFGWPERALRGVPVVDIPRAGSFLALSSEGTEAVPESPPLDRGRARPAFLAGVRLHDRGQLQDAALMYELAYVYSSPEPDPAILLNLGLLGYERGDDGRAKACLQGYLQRRSTAPRAMQVRRLLQSLSTTEPAPCVGPEAAANAREAEVRRGAQIRSWYRETPGGR